MSPTRLYKSLLVILFYDIDDSKYISCKEVIIIMANPGGAVRDMSNLVLTIVIYALVIGSILGSTAFAAITIINVTALSDTYGAAVVAITAFLAVGGTIIGILWFWKYAKGLLSGKSGLGSMSA